MQNRNRSNSVTSSRLLAIAILALGLSAATAYAEDGIIEEYPDVLNCTATSDSTQRVYRIVSKEGSSGLVRYRHAYSVGISQNVDYDFNADGSFNGNTNSPNSDCDGASLSSLISSGAAFYTRNQDVSGTSGQMSYFNLEACPDSWTRQIQLDRTINPDTPMVLCRKD